MSAANLTDLAESLINSTTNNTVTDSEDTWETRLQANRQYLVSFSIASVLCVLVFCLSIFSKHISGDYKWFVLNEALANFFCAFGSLTWTLLYDICLGPSGFAKLYFASNPPLWLTLYVEAVGVTVKDKFGRYAQMTTLFATVFNRWMAIALPNYYQNFMSRRLIILYCALCYLVVLPVDGRWFIKWNFPDTIIALICIGYFVIPWILSTIFSVVIFFKLWNHMRATTTITDKRRLQESRMVLYSLMIQIAVSLLDKTPDYFIQIGFILGIFTEENFNDSLLSVIFNKINFGNYMYTNAYTCIIILITMRPYRRAVLSLISPITKFCQHHLKANVTPKTADNRVAPKPNVLIVLPAGTANSP